MFSVHAPLARRRGLNPPKTKTLQNPFIHLTSQRPHLSIEFLSIASSRKQATLGKRFTYAAWREIDVVVLAIYENCLLQANVARPLEWRKDASQTTPSRLVLPTKRSQWDHKMPGEPAWSIFTNPENCIMYLSLHWIYQRGVDFRRSSLRSKPHNNQATPL